VFGEFINPEPVPDLRADQVTNGISDLLAPTTAMVSVIAS
jgi:hypothetical protein